MKGMDLMSIDALTVKVDILEKRVDTIEADFKNDRQRTTDAIIAIEKNTSTISAFLQTQSDQIKLLVDKQEKTESTLNQVNTDLQSMKARYDAENGNEGNWFKQMLTTKGLITVGIILVLFALGFNHEQIMQFLGM